MNTKEIVKKYLEDNGYEGLACKECGCVNEALMLCGEDPSECAPGHVVERNEEFCVLMPGKRDES